MREWLNNNPGVVGGVAALALLVALGVLFVVVQGNDLPAVGDTYYQDLETGELFTHQRMPTAPESPAGNPAAEAFVHSCGGCDNEDELFVAHLRVELPPDQRPAGMGEAAAIRVSADGSDWHPIESDRGAAITRRPTCDDGTRAERCLPDS